MLLLTAGSVLLLLCCSAFFSGSETVMTATSKSKMHTLAKDGDSRANVVLRLIEQKDRLIGALLLGNNLVNILASALTTKVMLELFGGEGVVYATLVMTVLVLIFAEVLPKTYALLHADKSALTIAPFIRIVVTIFAPVTEVVTWIVRQVLKIFGVNFAWSEVSSIEELRGAIDLHQGSGNDNTEDTIREERAMLRSVLDLADVNVGEIMTHRRHITAINADMTSREIVDHALSSPFTRIPLYQGEAENIVGVLHSKLLMRHLQQLIDDHGREALDQIDIMSLISEPWFVPETTTLFQQLHAFRARKEHFAVVVDEYGAVEGIVTLEDILEEIVGQIDDEEDTPTADLTPDVRDQSVVVEGSMTIRDLNREFEWDLPDEEYSTIAGLLLFETQSIPQEEQSFTFGGYKFDVVERQRHQLTKIKITPPAVNDDNTEKVT